MHCYGNVCMHVCMYVCSDVNLCVRAYSCSSTCAFTLMNARSPERTCGSWRVRMLLQAHATFHVSRLLFTHATIVIVVVMAGLTLDTLRPKEDHAEPCATRQGRLHQQTLSTKGRPSTCYDLTLILAFPPLSLLLPLLVICPCWSSKAFRAERRVTNARARNAPS